MSAQEASAHIQRSLLVEQLEQFFNSPAPTLAQSLLTQMALTPDMLATGANTTRAHIHTLISFIDRVSGTLNVSLGWLTEILDDSATHIITSPTTPNKLNTTFATNGEKIRGTLYFLLNASTVSQKPVDKSREIRLRGGQAAITLLDAHHKYSSAAHGYSPHADEIASLAHHLAEAILYATANASFDAAQIPPNIFDFKIIQTRYWLNMTQAMNVLLDNKATRQQKIQAYQEFLQVGTPDS